MFLDKATSILHDRHLNLGTVSDVQSDRTKGTVVSQSPESDKTVAWGTTVDLGLAVPIEVRRTPVPNVIGRDLPAAKAILDKSQLRAGPEIPRPSNEPAGQVIAQSIKPETVVPIGTSVGLAFAQQITVLVPNLVGRTVEEASNLLAKGQLALGETAFVEQDGPAGMVIAQDIPEGSPVPIGTRIIEDFTDSDAGRGGRAKRRGEIAR
jgi:beta-lactam-binding protein with PASTA domain